MIVKNLKNIAIMCGGELSNSEFENIQIKGVSTDTRTIKVDNLFIPIVGENFDGHDYVELALENGACASFWERHRPTPKINRPLIMVDDSKKAMLQLAKSYRESLDLTVIGITGSNGKTTTKDIIASLLQESFKVQKTMKNFNNDIGLPRTIFTLDEDTRIAVLELGTEDFGEISLLTSIAKPDIAIITNIGDAHLNTLITKENIARAKLEILEGLPENGIFIYNGDDAILKEVVKEFKLPEKTLTFGVEPHNDYVIDPIKYDETGNTFTLNEHVYTVPLLGEHQMYNGACAIIVATMFKLDYNNIARGLTNIDLTGMRNELLVFPDFQILNDSYKSNPQSLNSGLNTVYSLDGYSQKIAIIGDMLGLGNKEVEIHEGIGLTIDPEKIDYLLTVGELSKNIYKKAVERYPEEHVFHFDTKEELVEKAKEIIQKDSLIFVKASRFMELETVVDALSAHRL